MEKMKNFILPFLFLLTFGLTLHLGFNGYPVLFITSFISMVAFITFVFVKK
jgi:hypothetical protein